MLLPCRLFSQGAVCLQIQDTDIDTLERCCAAMAFGDLEAEAPQTLTETSFLRLFRLAQLTVEYLLHIQDRLVWENGLLKVAMLLIVWHTQSVSLCTAAFGGDWETPQINCQVLEHRRACLWNSSQRSTETR